MSPDVVLRRVCLRAARSLKAEGRLEQPHAALRAAIRREAAAAREDALCACLDGSAGLDGHGADGPVAEAMTRLIRACDSAPSETRFLRWSLAHQRAPSSMHLEARP